MPQAVRLWEVREGDRLHECEPSSLDLESRLEAWLAKDIAVLSPELMVIGRQVETVFGGAIDLLCIDRTGDLVIVELKRDKTPREITAQTLDYASWVKDLSAEETATIFAEYCAGRSSLADAFEQQFHDPLPDSLNQDHRMLIVAARLDPASERIVRYLSDAYGVDINAVTFQYYKGDEGREYLTRVFLIDPSEVEQPPRSGVRSKRRPNLTYEELEQLAEHNGVGALYRRLVGELERFFQKGTTRSSIAFSSVLDESRKAILAFIPAESDRDKGLCFQLYAPRLAKVLGAPEERIAGFLPTRREPWRYFPGAGDDFSGFRGFFASEREVDRFLEVFSRGAGGTTAAV